ncbi:MAG: tetratricopeptide repeat protein [Deltaproteobacteria bacterium]|nr:tetratricopeptide repeat protein [Deltaproteobacteria bacterium]
MAVIVTRKYNPGFLTDDELVGSFCVRTHEFESLMEILRECTGSANAHQIVIGSRGSGKTTLLLRIAAEVRRVPALSRRFFPIVFAEESYEVASPGEFWLECLSRLAAQSRHGDDHVDLSGTLEELRTTRDDKVLADRCLAVLLDFADRQKKRLVLVVENLNMMFRDMADPDAGWRLRHTLQTEPRIVMLASATSRFDEIDNPEHALYDQLRVLLLRPLDTTECAGLWETVSGRSPVPKTIRSLEILTGGSPRLLTIVARFGAGLSFRELMSELLDLVDDHTEYFKRHIESLPPQERRVYLALADLWKPATTREIADRSRLETSKCSAQLSRLIERGVVQVEGGTARRKQYYLTERLYNIYYLLRRSRGPDSLIEAIIQFMESFYSSAELKDIVARLMREAGSFNAEMLSLYRIAISRFLESPLLDKHRGELLTIVPDDTVERDARTLFARAATLNNQNHAEDALALWDELLLRFGQSKNPALLESIVTALFNKGVTLGRMNRLQEALGVYEEMVRRFGQSEDPTVLESVGKALFNKGMILGEMNRVQDALGALDEVVNRFGQSQGATLLGPVASAIVYKGDALDRLNRPQEALAAWGDVLFRFGQTENPALLEQVAIAAVNKGALSARLSRPHDALAAFDEMLDLFRENENPKILGWVAKALFNKGCALRELHRPKDALATWDDVSIRFRESQDPVVLEVVAKALFNKGDMLVDMNLHEDALTVWDEAVRRFGGSQNPDVLGWVAQALVVKGVVLDALDQPLDALTAFDEAIQRLGQSASAVPGEWMEEALLRKAGVELEGLRYEAAIESVGRALVGLRPESLARRVRGYLIRAKATLAGGNRSACECDIEVVLTLLQEIGSLPHEALDTLMYFSIELGPARVRELIQTSPSANLLLPLTTALERELGLEPRVAREVEEVAQDIRRDLAKLREARTMAPNRERLASSASAQEDGKDG